MSIKELSKRAKVVIVLVAIGLIGLGVVLSHETKSSEPEAEPEKSLVSLLSLDDIRGNTVVATASGEIESLEQISLSSEMSGVVSNVNVSIGDKVAPGQILVQFRASDRAAQLAQTQAEYENAVAAKDALLAQIETAKANHEKLIIAMESQINTAETAVKRAENNLNLFSPQNVDNVIPDAYDDARIFLISVHDVITRNIQVADNILDMNDEHTNDDFENLLGAQDLSTIYQVKASYISADSTNEYFYSKVNSLSSLSHESEIEAALESGVDALVKMKTLFLDLDALLDKTVTSLEFPQTSLDAMIATVNGSRQDISSTMTQLTNIIQSLKTAKDAEESGDINNEKNQNELEIVYEKAVEDLASVKRQAEAEIKASEAGIDQLTVGLSSRNAGIRGALASISAVRAEIAKSVVRTPIGGTVASLNVKAGELVSMGSNVAEVVNTEGLQVKAFIPGNALSAIKIGGAVLVENQPVGSILRIAPSINQTTKKVEVIVSITPNENTSFLVGQFVELQFLGDYESEESQTVLVPLRAVKIGSESHEVFIVNNDGVIEAVPVETGQLIGDKIEIVSDLSGYNAIVSEVQGLEVGEAVVITQ